MTMDLVPMLRDRGFALTAFGDFPLADTLSPALTVIDQDPFALGTLAAQRILDRLEKPQRRYRRRTILPVSSWSDAPVSSPTGSTSMVPPVWPASAADVLRRSLP